MEKIPILCDSSSLIALTDSCFLDIVYNLHKSGNASFLIPDSVRRECIDRPLTIKQYSMAAVRLLDAVNDGVLEEIKMNLDIDIDQVLEISNNIFYARGKSMHLVDRGEAGLIAAANKLDIKSILMDERTTRMLIEEPDALKSHLANELNVHIAVNEANMAKFQEMTKGINVFRSSELILIAYEKGWFNRFQGIEIDALRAALYRVKFAGCSVSFDEIDEAVSVYVSKR